jgi:uncharacterized membrane protein YfhO
MTNLISGAIASVSSLFQRFQIKQFLAVVLVGFLLLTTSVDAGRSSRAIAKEIDKAAHQDDSQRPKTLGEWQNEARETRNAPGERLERIKDQTGEALKDWGGLYPDTAKRSGDQLKDDAPSYRR